MTTKEGASRLALDLSLWWRKQGYSNVKFRIELDNAEGWRAGYCVRSNLVNGLPPGGASDLQVM